MNNFFVELYILSVVEYSTNIYNILDSKTHTWYLPCNNSALLNYTMLADDFNTDELINIIS